MGVVVAEVDQSDPDAEVALSNEIRRQRLAAGLSQAKLASRIGYSREYVSRAEQPSRGLASADLVRAVDAALGAEGSLVALHARVQRARLARRRRQPARAEPVMGEQMNRSQFLQLAAVALAGGAVFESDGRTRTVDGGRGSWAAETDEAVLDPIGHAGRWTDQADLVGCPPLRLEIDRAMARSLTGSYRKLNAVLPRLIGRAEAQALVEAERLTAHRDLADVYSVACWMLIKSDCPIGAWIAAQRAVRAAERAQDPRRLAAATRCVAEVHMRNGNHEEASHTALLAAVTLDGIPRTEDQDLVTSLRGAALLSAAAACARRGDRRGAHVALGAAMHCADALGRESYELATVFGPTNVAIHRVALAVELGEFGDAVRLTQEVQLAALPAGLGERRSRYLLDVARAHAGVGDVDTAAAALLQAEAVAADEVHTHRITRALVPELLVRQRHDTGLRALAQRAHLAA